MKLQNRARVMLTAVAVLAIVGGALAFKARRTLDVYCSLTTTNAATSTLQHFKISTTGSLTYCTQEFEAPIVKKTFITPNA